MQGIPGSGKSTVARGIRAVTAGVILSTDDFWYEVVENPGLPDEITYRGDVYNFDISRLGKAHTWNQSRANDCMAAGTPTVIIDNTNIRNKDIGFYLACAVTYGYTVQIVRVTTPIETCVDRQKERPEDRRIPTEVIYRMAGQMEELHVRA